MFLSSGDGIPRGRLMPAARGQKERENKTEFSHGRENTDGSSRALVDRSRGSYLKGFATVSSTYARDDELHERDRFRNALAVFTAVAALECSFRIGSVRCPQRNAVADALETARSTAA